MDILAALFTLLGLYLLGNDNEQGWIASMLGNFLWGAYAMETGQPALYWLNLCLLIFSIRGWSVGSGGTADVVLHRGPVSARGRRECDPCPAYYRRPLRLVIFPLCRNHPNPQTSAHA